jgi:multidrug resistance efflux pump
MLRTHLPSSHATTNLAVIEQFLPVRLRFDADAASHVLRAGAAE